MLRHRLALAVLVAFGATYACVESTSTLPAPSESTAAPAGTTGSGQGFDKRALLAQVANGIVLPTYREFVTLAEALEAATGAYAGSLASADRDAAREAWRAAMRVWQRAELMQLGPAGRAEDTPGGQGLRDEIYSWDYVNPCAVDQKLVDRAYADLAVLKNQLITVRGLDAMEYLLFYQGTTNACAPQNVINASGSWQAMAGELEQRRADYAHALAKLVVERAVELRDAWEPQNGNFAAKLSQPGSPYANEQEALNAVFAAMFYLDLVVKDMKLATPAGLSDMCAYEVCPDEVESRYAHFSKQELGENLRSFQTLFLGAAPGQDGVGFDDWLLAVGKGDLALRLSSNLQGAIGALEAVEEDDLVAALAADPESVRAAHAAVKKVTDDLKSELLSVLDLELPKPGEGDND